MNLAKGKNGNIPEFSPDGINLNFKLLPLYANEVIICKFGLFCSANSNSISLENLEVRWEEVEIRAGSIPGYCRKNIRDGPLKLFTRSCAEAC